MARRSTFYPNATVVPLRLRGVLTHEGHIAGEADRPSLERAGRSAGALLARTAEELRRAGHGRAAGVNFAEAFYHMNNETHNLLTVTEAAHAEDPLTRHITYSAINLRETYPVGG